MRTATLFTLLLGLLVSCGSPPPAAPADRRPPPPPEWRSRNDDDRPIFHLDNEMTREEAEAAGLLPPEPDEDEAAD